VARPDDQDFSLIGLSFPNFWLAIMLVLLLSSSLLICCHPVAWRASPASLCPQRGIILTATNVRLVRTTMLDTLRSQYIMVARAKGLSNMVVLYKHALRNCSIPLITYFGLQFGGLLGGIGLAVIFSGWLFL
tara:strand:- start:12841 stop:13236 length:396 start_codon:yes stop_codon:yes gene_type:complete